MILPGVEPGTSSFLRRKLFTISVDIVAI